MKIILTTCAPDDAAALVRAMLEVRLVGCGNILPGVRSIYRWDGAIQDDTESLIVMETQNEKVERAIEHLHEIHPYSVPKIVAWEPTHVLPSYSQWLAEETSP